jgi:hypothetical protein
MFAIGHFTFLFKLFVLVTFSSIQTQQIAQLDLSTTWAFGVRWSPSGKTLAYAGFCSP